MSRSLCRSIFPLALICTRFTELQTRDELEVRPLKNSLHQQHANNHLSYEPTRKPLTTCGRDPPFTGHATTQTDVSPFKKKTERCPSLAFGGVASAPPRALGIATCVTGVAEGFAGDRSSRGRGRARDEEEKERARVQGSSLPILSRVANLSRRCPIRRLPDYPGRTVFVR